MACSGQVTIDVPLNYFTACNLKKGVVISPEYPFSVNLVKQNEDLRIVNKT